MKREWIHLATTVLFLGAVNLSALEIAGGVAGGDARGVYLSQDTKGNTKSAQGFALNPKFNIKDDFLDFSLEVGGAAAISFSEELQDFGGYNRFASSDKQGVTAEGDAWLNRYNITFNNRSGYFVVGQQELDTPLLGSGTDRMTPATFEALTYVNTRTFPSVRVTASRIQGMDSWDTSGRSSMFEALFENDTQNDDNKSRLAKCEKHGITVFGVDYAWEMLRARGWSYQMVDRTRAHYSDSSYGDKKIVIKPGSMNYGDAGLSFGDDLVAFELLYQYAQSGFRIGADDGFGAAENFASLNQRLTGFKIEAAFNAGLSIYAATNSIKLENNSLFGRYVNGWGGYPEFAIAEEYTLNRFANRSFSTIKAAINFEMGAADVGISTTQFSGKKEQGEDASATITDFTLRYQSLSLLYETQELYKSAPEVGPSYNTLIKAELVKHF